MEDGAVVIAVLDEEFEVLNVNWRQIGVQLNGDRPAAAAAPRQFEFNDVGGGVASVGDVDHCQHKHASAMKIATMPAGVGVPSLSKRGKVVSLMPLSCISLRSSL